MVKRVTDRLAVEAAMDEYDRVGRDAFLQKHNFGPALRYFVTRNGKRYDSKAIYGAAHEIQFPDDGKMSSADFSGGEKPVQAPLEALGFGFVIDNEGRAEEAAEPDLEIGKITYEDVRLLGSSQAKQKYSDLSDEEHAAYVRVSATLQALGERLKSALRNSDKFEARTTSGFNVNSGVRSYIPKDLWFSVSPRDNATDLAGMPQLFMIVSERGIEYGFGASVHPSDFSKQSIKQLVREAAPIVFDQLPAFDTAEASEIQADIETTGQWYFRRKHRLPPNQNDFSSFKDWLRFLLSEEGKKNAAGTISRYLQGEQIDQTDLQTEVATMASLFSPLLDREWHNSSRMRGGERERDLAGKTEFPDRLRRFLEEFADKRTGSFAIDDALRQAMRELTAWLKQLPSVASRPTISVKISVGQGGLAKTPWIALLDERELTTTQRGTYVVFLVAEDLSITYLTLNQGMTELRNRLGQRGAAEEMVGVAEASRPIIKTLEDRGFTLDNQIDLRSNTDAAKNCEIGTIAHFSLESDALPDDAAIEDYLENLLSGYERVLEARDRPNVGDDDPIVQDPAAPYSIDDALAELFLERADIEQYLDIWASKKNLILQGAPGVGKSFIARRLAYALIGSKDNSKTQTVQFHQSYS